MLCRFFFKYTRKYHWNYSVKSPRYSHMDYQTNRPITKKRFFIQPKGTSETYFAKRFLTLKPQIRKTMKKKASYPSSIRKPDDKFPQTG